MAKKRPQREGIMLCYTTEPGRVSRLGKEIIVQPKYRGERAHIEWFAGEPVLISSYGNDFKFLDHIKAKLLEIKGKVGQIPFDGELYKHGWSQEKISGILRSTVNKHPDTEGLEYHVFDLKDRTPCLERIKYLYTLRSVEIISPESTVIQISPSFLIPNEEWMDYAVKFVDLRYEGIILRNINAPWEAKRTVNMLKFKPTEKDKYVILSVNEAIDQYGDTKSMVGSFTVKAKDTDESFKVGAGKMSHKRRIELWQLRSMLPGKMLEVKHELIRTSGAVPVCAVAVDVEL